MISNIYIIFISIFLFFKFSTFKDPYELMEFVEFWISITIFILALMIFYFNIFEYEFKIKMFNITSSTFLLLLILISLLYINYNPTLDNYLMMYILFYIVLIVFFCSLIHIIQKVLPFFK